MLRKLVSPPRGGRGQCVSTVTHKLLSGFPPNLDAGLGLSPERAAFQITGPVQENFIHFC